MIKILIASDKYKGTFSSAKIGNIIENAIKKQIPAVQTCLFPVSDGGEGFIDAINYIVNGVIKQIKVHNSVFIPTKSKILLSADNAYIESAEAIGLAKLPFAKRNPMKTSSYGLGELIKYAIENGSKKIFVGLGGSATTDLGIGMANAIGYRFLDENGREVIPVGENMIKIKKITYPTIAYFYQNIEFTVITDVRNPLYGQNGAAYIFAPQKGANQEQVEILDMGLKNISDLIIKYLKKDVANIPGSGAAGGLGAAFLAFLDAKIIDGSSFIIDFLNLEQKIKSSDIIITGEGKIDEQTFNGKFISGIISAARKYNKKVIAICGVSTITNEKQFYDNLDIIPLFDTGKHIKNIRKRTIERINSLNFCKIFQV